jgi:hypothetical protein
LGGVSERKHEWEKKLECETGNRPMGARANNITLCNATLDWKYLLHYDIVNILEEHFDTHC